MPQKPLNEEQPQCRFGRTKPFHAYCTHVHFNLDFVVLWCSNNVPHPSESSKRRRRHVLTSDQVLRQHFLHFRQIWAASGMSSVPYSQIRELIKEPRKFGTSWSQWFSCLQPPNGTHACQKTGSPNWSYGPVPALRVDLSQLGHIWLLFWSPALWTVKHMKTDLNGFVHETDHMLPLPLTGIYRKDNNGGIFRIPFFF